MAFVENKFEYKLRSEMAEDLRNYSIIVADAENTDTANDCDNTKDRFTVFDNTLQQSTDGNFDILQKTAKTLKSSKNFYSQ